MGNTNFQLKDVLVDVKAGELYVSVAHEKPDSGPPWKSELSNEKSKNYPRYYPNPSPSPRVLVILLQL